MTIHDHDPDLIMALADGSLAESSRPAAEEGIAGCPECSADLARHRVMIETLRAAPTVELTQIESARMRRTLRRELELVVESKSNNRAAAWNRWLAVGAAAAVLVGVVSVAPRLNLLGSGDTSTDVGAFAQTTTAAVAEDAAGGAADVFPEVRQSATGGEAVNVTDADLSKMLSELDSRAFGSEANVIVESRPYSCADSIDSARKDEAALRLTARYRDLTVEIVGYDDGSERELVVYDAATCDIVTTIAGEGSPTP